MSSLVPTPESVTAGLNAPQREAVEHEGSPLLVVAGAGSGKTRVLAHRVAHLILVRGFDPGEILAVTFTRKAAQEMGERIRVLLPGVEPCWWVGTFHALGARILRRLAPRCGRQPNFVIYDQDDTLRLLKHILARESFSWELSPAEARAALESAKQRLRGVDLFAEEAVGPREQTLADIYRIYERELSGMNAFDFADLITQPTVLFRADPETLRPYAERFREVLVDEYQDTNHAQYLLLSALSSHHAGLVVVGDDDQSIYAWRGADLSNILDFERDFPRARVIRLEQNYRSTASILEAAQGLIAHNDGRREKVLWTDGPSGESPVLVMTADEKAEAQAVVREIQRLVSLESRQPGEVAVLYRTNAQSRALEEALRRAPIRYVLVGTLRFYERREIKDLLAYLRLLVNPLDEMSLRRIINTPPRGIGPRTLAKVTEWASRQGIPFVEAAMRPRQVSALGETAIRRMEAFAQKLGEWRERAGEEAPPLVARRVLADAGIWEQLASAGDQEAEERRENLRELLSSLEDFARENPEAGLASYLEDVVLSADIDGWEGGGGTVTLMTLHNAKGLEFPLVFITGLEEGLLPHRSALESEGRLEEERRLLYVGITRAQERVWLAAAASRRAWEGGGRRHLSRFINEIPPGCLQFREVGGEGDRPRAWSRREEGVASDPFPDYGRDEEGGDWVDPRLLSPGQWVRHPDFGRGKVLAREGQGVNLKLTVLFENGRKKKLMARYARLELI